MAEGCHERPAVRQITLMMMMLIAKGGEGLEPLQAPLAAPLCFMLWSSLMITPFHTEVF